MFLLDFLVGGNYLRAGDGDRGEGVGETHEQAEGTDFAGRAVSMFLPGKDVHICFSLLWYGAA